MNKNIKIRYEKGGIEALTDKEMFEVITGKTCEEQAIYLREAIDNTENVKVRLFKDIFVKYLEQKIIKKKIFCRSSKEVFDYLYASMRNLDTEIFNVIYLNSQNMVLKVETLFKGTLTSTSIYPREVIKGGLKYKAAAFIFAYLSPKYPNFLQIMCDWNQINLHFCFF